MSGKTALIGICLVVVAAGAFGGYVWVERQLKPRTTAVERTLPPLDFHRGRGLGFTFVDTGGALQEAASLEEIPEDARELVRVTDPSVRRTDRTASLVYVADLRVAAPDGSYPYRIMSDGQFRALALPQMSDTGMHVKYEPESEPPPPPRVKGPRRKGKGAPAPLPELIRGTAGLAGANPGGAAPAPVGGKSVTLYTTAWCPACVEARSYLQRRGVPFVEKDIEKDAAADREYAQKCARIGQAPGRVPGVEIGGRLMIGFAPGRVESLLRR